MEVERRVARGTLEEPLEVAVHAFTGLVPRQDDALVQRAAGVADQEVGIHRHLRAEAGAFRAGAEGALNENVRGSISVSCVGWPLGQLSFSLNVRVPRTFDIDEVDRDEALAEPQRGLDRVGEAGEQVVGGDETVDHDRDVVLSLLEHRRVSELDDLAVDDRARVALGGESRKRSTNSPFFCEITGASTW